MRLYEFDVRIFNESENDIPSYAKDGDSGMDIRAKDDFAVYPGETKMIETGIYVRLPFPGLEIQVRPRSGMSSKTKLRVSNSPGTVDCIPAFENILCVDGVASVAELLVKPTTILSYSEPNKKLEEDEITNMWQVGTREVFKLTFDDGSCVNCTANQKILTSSGWMAALDIGNDIDIISV